MTFPDTTFTTGTTITSNWLNAVNDTIVDGAASIEYTPPFTGGVAETLSAKLAQTISVKDFGAVGNGVADDTTAITNAFAAMASGGTLLFPQGTYKVTAPIASTFNNGAVVNIIGYGAKIDGTSVTGGTAGDTTLLTLGGKRNTGVALSVSAAQYDTSITTSTSISANVNDIALISSTDLFNPTRAYYYKGEFIEMRGISGTTIQCHDQLFDSYTNTTTTVYPLSTPTVTIQGLEIQMNANQLALVVSYCRNPHLRDLKVHGARYTNISLQYCFGGTVENCESYDSWYSGTGTSYGISVATCQNTVVTKNNITEARHCITGGGWEPCRNVIYSNNICTVHPSETIAASIDQHGNMEYCSILGNVANGGIEISSINATVSNNTITEFRTSVTQSLLVYQEIDSNFYNISNNTINAPNGTVYGIWVTPTVASLTINNLNINNNTINSAGSAIRLQPRNTGATGCLIKFLVVKSNICNTSATSQVSCIFSNTSGVNLTATSIQSANNIYYSQKYRPLVIVGTITNLFSNGDKFYGDALNDYLISINSTNSYFNNAYFEANVNGSGNSRSIYYVGTGVVQNINPIFKNLTYKAELNGPNLYIEQGWYEATPTIVNTSGTKLVNFYGRLGRATTYDTAAPTTNTWAVGDRVYNQSPAVGQPKSWVCTVAGTPGTWVSEGNL